MLWFNDVMIEWLDKINYISIHLMLWFNAKEEKPVILLLEFQYILCYGSTRTSYQVNSLIIISIHLMLWFNSILHSDIFSLQQISIHLMLWFNNILNKKIKYIFSFQYILCYGSTYNLRFLNTPRPNFNTSYVMVQRDAPCVWCEGFEISIHLMLWFNKIHNVHL